MGKKVYLIAFRQGLTKILPAAFILLHNYDLFEKARSKLSPLIQNSVQQDYIAESCSRYLLSYQKCQNIDALARCGLSLLPRKGMGENPTRKPKINSFPSSGEFPLIELNLSLSKVSFLPHINSNYHFQVPYATFICSCSYFCSIVF